MPFPIEAFLIYDPPFKVAPHNNLIVVIDKTAPSVPRILLDQRKLWGSNKETSELRITVYLTTPEFFERISTKMKAGVVSSEEGTVRQVIDVENLTEEEETEFVNLFVGGCSRLNFTVDRAVTRIVYIFKPTDHSFDKYLTRPTIIGFDFAPAMHLVPGRLNDTTRTAVTNAPANADNSDGDESDGEVGTGHLDASHLFVVDPAGLAILLNAPADV